MCGRYYLDDGLAEYLNMNQYVVSSYKRGDIFPSEKVPVIRNVNNRLKVSEMIWGFPAGNQLIINARAESLHEKPMFKNAVRYRRCIIPACKYYEWNKEKEKVTFERPESKNAGILFMAGFYDMFEEERFVIITTKANPSVEPVHNRMPLILEEDEVEDWIFGDDIYHNLLKKEPGSLKKFQEYEQLSFNFS